MSRISSLLPAMFLLCRLCAAARAADAPDVQATVLPRHPIIEKHAADRLLDFDMVVRNNGKETFRIAKLEVSVYDGKGRLATRKALNTDAFAPSIAVIGDNLLTPGKTLDVFNPFWRFDAAMPLDRLAYDFCLQREDDAKARESNRHRLPDDCDAHVALAVVPRVYDGKTALTLPLKGKLFVWEGHDFYAHHLRVPLGNARIRAMGLEANSNEFASDFIYTDDQGNPYHGDPRKLENWFSYGKPIYAPGAGVVKEAVGDIPDNGFKDDKATAIAYPKLPPDKDPKDLGNHVLIDHGNGEFSLLLHMKPGSVKVKAGDPVAQGQEIGAIGFSGDAIFPHLHYALMDGPETGKAWGLPAAFGHLRRFTGTASRLVGRDTVNSGDVVETDMR